MAGDRNLLLRVASAVVALPILGAVVLWREPLGFALLALAAAAVALREYAGLTLAGRPAGERAAVVVLGVAFAAALYLRPDLGPVWAMIAVVLVAASALVHTDDMSAASGRLAAAAFGVFYVGGLVAALPLVHRDAPDGAGSLWVIVAIAVTFASDTGAYFVGRALGRHKLAPAISPGKTVEGAVGGLGAALAFMFIARATFFESLGVRDCLLVGLAAGVLGPIGDLMESLLKRSAGVKDSGHLIPGHGGMLDRIDALLFVGAYVYLHVRFFY
jgi:phosphatidate cytidylyltransferase